MKRKLNTLSLSGLMVGPVLGSGIVVLPSIAFQALGCYAMYAWMIMMLLGGGFAYVFTRMSMLATTNEGVSQMIGTALGEPFQELSANYLIAAVCFGPIAVAQTAAGYIKSILPVGALPSAVIPYAFILINVLVLLCGIRVMGSVSLILSSITAVLLTSGGIFSLAVHGLAPLPTGLPDLYTLGSTLLILFWAIIGWEVIGNYVEDVQNPTRTLPRAMKVSVIAVVLVYFVVTYALQCSPQAAMNSDVSLNAIMTPLFHGAAPYVLGAVALALCYCTILMVLGAITRQVAVRAGDKRLPKFLAQKPGSRAPVASILSLTAIHCVIIAFMETGVITVNFVVGIANTFFIGNALLGLAGAFIYMKSVWLRALIALLALGLGMLLLFSPTVGWILFIGVTAGTLGLAPRMKAKHVA